MKFLFSLASAGSVAASSAGRFIYQSVPSAVPQLTALPQTLSLGLTPPQHAEFQQVLDLIEQELQALSTNPNLNVAPGNAPLVLDTTTGQIRMRQVSPFGSSTAKLVHQLTMSPSAFGAASVPGLNTAAIQSQYGMTPRQLVDHLNMAYDHGVQLAALAATLPTPTPATPSVAPSALLTPAVLAALPANAFNTMPNAQIQQWINSLNGLQGAALQNHINALATALSVTLTGGGTQGGLLKVDGVVGGGTRRARAAVIEALRLKMLVEADVYSRVEITGTPNAAALKEALKKDPEGKQLLCQLQADMMLLPDKTDPSGNTKLYAGPIDGHRGVNYGFGPKTSAAVDKALAQYGGTINSIRHAARLHEVQLEAAKNNGTNRTNEGIDLVAQTTGYTTGDLEKFLAQYKVTANMPANLTTPQQQKAWIIEQAILMGDNDAPNKTTFIEGLSALGNDRIREVMVDLRANFEKGRIDKINTPKGQLFDAMQNGIDLNPSDFAQPELLLAGRRIDSSLLDSAYIVTGNSVTKDVDGSSQRGTMEVPIFNQDGTINAKFGELQFAHATYINGAIVMTMRNGCEGNLVIIPVQREKYVPRQRTTTPRRPRNQVTTTQTTETYVPEEPFYEERCFGDNGTWQYRRSPDEPWRHGGFKWSCKTSREGEGSNNPGGRHEKDDSRDDSRE